MFACAKRQFCHETDRLANAITVASGSQYYRLSFAPPRLHGVLAERTFSTPRQTTGASPAAGGGCARCAPARGKKVAWAREWRRRSRVQRLAGQGTPLVRDLKALDRRVSGGFPSPAVAPRDTVRRSMDRVRPSGCGTAPPVRLQAAVDGRASGSAAAVPRRRLTAAGQFAPVVADVRPGTQRGVLQHRRAASGGCEGWRACAWKACSA